MAVNVKQIADRVVFQDILRPIPQHVELCRGFLNGFQKTLVFAFNVFGSDAVLGNGRQQVVVHICPPDDNARRNTNAVVTFLNARNGALIFTAPFRFGNGGKFFNLRKIYHPPTFPMP